MARRAARNGAVLGGNDAELNDLVAALESEVEERAAATERHDKKPPATQFARRMLAGCILLRLRLLERCLEHSYLSAFACARRRFGTALFR